MIVRYLHPVSEEVHNTFFNFNQANELDTDSVLASIKCLLSQRNIDIRSCVSQRYDGAPVMLGCNNGVQEKFRKEVPKAIYIHCHVHKLNLVLVETLKMFFNLSQQRSPLRSRNYVTLDGQYNGIWAVKKTLSATRATLCDIIDQSSSQRRIEARAISAIIQSLFCLSFFLRRYSEQLGSCQTSYRPSILILKWQVKWPSC